MCVCDYLQPLPEDDHGMVVDYYDYPYVPTSTAVTTSTTTTTTASTITTTTTAAPPSSPSYPSSTDTSSITFCPSQESFDRSLSMKDALAEREKERVVDTSLLFPAATTTTPSPTNCSPQLSKSDSDSSTSPLLNPKGYYYYYIKISFFSILGLILFLLGSLCFFQSVRAVIFHACEKCFRYLPRLANVGTCFRRRGGIRKGGSNMVPLSGFTSTTSVSFSYLSRIEEEGEGESEFSGQVEVGGGQIAADLNNNVTTPQLEVGGSVAAAATVAVTAKVEDETAAAAAVAAKINDEE